MKNIFTEEKLQKFSSLVGSAERIAVVSHTNPDGDAVGSGLALALFLRAYCPGAKVRFYVPNHYPAFLSWVDPERDVEVFGENCAEGAALLAAADAVVVADFNDPRRAEGMGTALERNLHAPRILVDHHLAPPDLYALQFHSTESSSTAYLVYRLIEALGGELTLPIANALYLGIMTDTGCFSHSNLEGDLFRACGRLMDAGVDAAAVNRAVYNAQSESRVRMLGYVVCEKMVLAPQHRAAYMTLTSDEKLRFNHQIGDTEGLVNIPLTIEGIDFSAILIQTKDCIKVSLRSVGDLDVNLMAREHFNGGGHKNAAGGKFLGSMEEAVASLEQVISTIKS